MSEQEAAIAPDVGQRLRAARLAAGISLRALARALGRSPSLLSAIETGSSKPSVRTLYAICSELGVSLDAVFAPDVDVPACLPSTASTEGHRATRRGAPVESAHGFVVPAGAAPRLELEAGISWERLNPLDEHDVDVLLITYPPGAATGIQDRRALLRHHGLEHGYILEGTLHVTLAFEEHVLRAGDAITFPASTPHRLSNDTASAVRALWTVVRSSDPA